MATLTIRNLPEETRRALKERAARSNRSMEAEVRDILQEAVSSRSSWVTEWLDHTAALRGDFELPERSSPRGVDLA
ncbi:MAG: Arc family DNA-binding protein [Aeromicrobium sp.]|uniref:FitA-like ribbon-helix-helix domain-containing protein n=1 Tax=Aeromicrobium sp. TaxID=1871063 RepID=UPI0039E3C430